MLFLLYIGVYTKILLFTVKPLLIQTIWVYLIEKACMPFFNTLTVVKFGN